MKTLSSLLVAAGCLFLASCSNSTDGGNDEYLKTSSEATLSKSGTQTYLLTTPDARKDKHAKFVLLYAWGNENDRKNNAVEPPLGWRLQLNPGTSYFVTAAAKMEKNASGEYWWRVTNDIAAKNETAASVRYEISASLQNYASDTASVKIVGEIQYVSYVYVQPVTGGQYGGQYQY